jgi:hypothetical protein
MTRAVYGDCMDATLLCGSCMQPQCMQPQCIDYNVWVIMNYETGIEIIRTRLCCAADVCDLGGGRDFRQVLADAHVRSLRC